jgi:hypothetical protein
MSAGAKLASFAVVLAIAFGGAAAVGHAVGPFDVGDGDTHSGDRSGHGGGAASEGQEPRGLAIAAAGYRLVADPVGRTAGSPSTLAFRIVDEERGSSLAGFDVVHERPLHLIVLSRNLVDYLHLHPTMDDSGRWTTELPALDAGSYRVFADFQPHGGDPLTLATDLSVAGEVPTTDIPQPTRVDTIGDLTVTLDGDRVTVGDSELAFRGERIGRAVRTEPYLGALGHLVAIRAGDLAFLHVHPTDADDGDAHDRDAHAGAADDDADDDVEGVTFGADLPSAGTYRVFFDFSVDGVVRTADFTLEVNGS